MSSQEQQSTRAVYSSAEHNCLHRQRNPTHQRQTSHRLQCSLIYKLTLELISQLQTNLQRFQRRDLLHQFSRMHANCLYIVMFSQQRAQQQQQTAAVAAVNTR